MSAKKADAGTRVMSAVAGMAAAFVARKLLTFAWTKATGRKPPEHPEDPQVALGEALAWGIIVGAGVHTARLLATRATGRRTGTDLAEPAPELERN
ncbi:MAG TPA: DUF4235 domain-containing protein [Streptosporangiaceae bacterium]|jgi:hypothetical protein